jgi:hypothetical protein
MFALDGLLMFNNSGGRRDTDLKLSVFGDIDLVSVSFGLGFNVFFKLFALLSLSEHKVDSIIIYCLLKR